MKLGFSFSPGGLLLPYHLGVLESLQFHGHVDPVATPLAGASAGAIAVAAVATQLDTRRVLDVTVDICEHCQRQYGRVYGHLLPLLKQHLHRHIGNEQFEILQERQRSSTITGIAYKELYPKQRNVLQTEFESRHDFVTAVCHSSMFPFFTSQFPALLDLGDPRKAGGVRLVVDGVFAVPWDRTGCPDLLSTELNNGVVDREIRVSVVPQALLGKNVNDNNNCIISPPWNGAYQLGRLARLATQGSDREELTWLYEAGMQDAERWCRNEQDRETTSLN